MNNRNIVSLFLFSVAILINSDHKSHADEIRFIPHFEDNIAEKIAEYTTISSPANNYDKLPSYELNKYIFVTILGTPALLEKLSDSDYQIISSLPDHTDQRFTQISYDQIENACQEILASKGSATRIATLFADARNLSSHALDEHYEGVHSQLSDSALRVIDSVKEEISGTTRLVHSEVDYISLSDEAPVYVETLHTLHCEQLIARGSPKHETRLLKDIFQNAEILPTFESSN